MTDLKGKILAPEQLAARIVELQAAGHRVVQCHGCFDIVHPGHIRYLQFAKSLGEVLVVSVSGDDAVHKGWDRPYVTEDLRAENLAALTFVDYVTVDHHDWAGPILETLQPNIYVKGREYEQSSDLRFIKERALVEQYGGQVVFSSGDVVFSSSAILARERNRMGLEADRIVAYCKRNALDVARVDELIRRFADRDILVMGDAILDVYVHCENASVAAESPVLNVTATTEERYVGGAGLIARQLSALGARVTFLTTHAEGAVADEIFGTLTDDGVAVRCVGDEERPVFTKTRFLVAGQKVFKVNRGARRPPSAATTAALEAAIDEELATHDALVVSDFGYGLFGPRLSSYIAEATAGVDKRYYADISGSGQASLMKFAHPRLATPTEAELRFALGDPESGLSILAMRYFEQSRAEGLIITLGGRGALHFAPPAEGRDRLVTEYLPALELRPVDQVGAGDSFLAAITLADLARATPAEGLYLASLLASHKVARVGNDPVLLDELVAGLASRPELAG